MVEDNRLRCTPSGRLGTSGAVFHELRSSDQRPVISTRVQESGVRTNWWKAMELEISEGEFLFLNLNLSYLQSASLQFLTAITSIFFCTLQVKRTALSPDDK